MRAFLVSIFCLVLISTAAMAADIYTDGNGSCSADPSTTYDPATRTSGGGSDTCYPTINKGIAGMVGGDTLHIRAGTYVENIADGIPSGLGSWATATTITGYTGETAILRPTSGITIQLAETADVSWLIIKDLTLEGTDLTTCNRAIGIGTNRIARHIRITGNTLQNFPASGIIVGGNLAAQVTWGSEFIEIINNAMTNLGDIRCPDTYISPGATGVYQRGDDVLLEGNTFTNVTGTCFQYWTQTHPIQNGIVRYNICVDIDGAGMTIGSSTTNTQIYNNIVRDSNNGGISYCGNSTNSYYNNTHYNNNVFGNRPISCGPNALGASVAAKVKNNIWYLSGTNATYQPADNLYTDPTFTNAAGGDLSLAAGSSAIDTAPNTTLPATWNGSGPDYGAHETFTCEESASVGDPTADNVVRIMCENSVRPPTTDDGSCNAAAWTIGGVACSPTVTACDTTVGDNIIDLTLSCNVVSGDSSPTYSYNGATGDITNTGIGQNNAATQPLHSITTAAITNNVGAPSTCTVTQSDFRWKQWGGTVVDSTDWKAAADTDYTVLAGRLSCARLRIKWEGSVANCASAGYRLRVDKNGAASYADVPSATPAACPTGAACLVEHPDLTHGAAVTEQLPASSSFVAGDFLSNQVAVPPGALAVGAGMENEYAICVQSGTAGDTHDFRIYTDAGAALDAYTVTPRLTVRAPDFASYTGKVTGSGGTTH